MRLQTKMASLLCLLATLPSGTPVGGLPQPTSRPRSSQAERATKSFELLKHVFQLVLSNYLLPARDRDEINRFISRGRKERNLSQLVTYLQKRSTQLAQLRWDSRLGVLALTLGVEWTLLTGLMLGANWVYFTSFGFLALYKTVLLYLFYVVLFFLGGFLYRSTPIFHFMDIDVVDRRGGPASRFQSGLRMMLAWAPFCFAMIGFVGLLQVGFEASEASMARKDDEACRARDCMA